MPVRVHFCGQDHLVTADRPLVIGREADVDIDENPFLHRAFLRVEAVGELWMLSNIGSRLTATVADDQGLMHAWLAPGARVPLVFACTVVWFTAGPTTYQLEIYLDSPPFALTVGEEPDGAAGPEHDLPAGDATVGAVSFTRDQKLLILALTEHALRRGELSGGAIPGSADAAARLGWTLTRFNRKLDNVCQKLAQCGVRGLHGRPEQLATNRRARLAEYALAARLVIRSDLAMLDRLNDEGSAPTSL